MYQPNRHIDFTDLKAGQPNAETEAQDFLQKTPESSRETGERQNQEKAGSSGTEKQKKKVRVKELIDGTFLVRENMIRQLPYLLFLTFLGVIYIGNRFHAEHMVRQINELKIEVGNLRAEQITTTSELMNISRPSEVAALVEAKGLGLKESMEPPKKLKR
jgi:hypothetical protein